MSYAFHDCEYARQDGCHHCILILSDLRMLFYANGGLGAHSVPLCKIAYHTGLSTLIFWNSFIYIINNITLDAHRAISCENMGCSFKFTTQIIQIFSRAIKLFDAVPMHIVNSSGNRSVPYRVTVGQLMFRWLLLIVIRCCVLGTLLNDHSVGLQTKKWLFRF